MNIQPVNHPEKGGNQYCGPAALSIVTGMDTGSAARLIRKLDGRALVKGTLPYQMGRAYEACGIRMLRVKVKPSEKVVIRTFKGKTSKDDRPTMTQWLRDSKNIRTAGRVFLVLAGHHWQIISGRRFCCGKVREIISITDKRANRRARVEAVYELTAPGKITIPESAQKKRSAWRESGDRDRLKKEERQIGVKGSLVWSHGVQDYVIPPCEEFPRGFSICHYDWPDTLEKFLFFVNDPIAYEESADEDGHISF